VVTYVSRPEHGLEGVVSRYLNVGQRVLAVSGPSKAGKSTLVNRVLRERQAPFFRLTGSSLTSMDRFWEILAHQASVPSSVQTTEESASSSVAELSSRIGGGAIPASLASKFAKTYAARTAVATSAAVALSEAVREVLIDDKVCLVIDDFHHAPAEVRSVLAREIKDLVFLGARVILVAIPERVMQVLQDEGELVGRVKYLKVRQWEPLELLRIAVLGFEALRIDDLSEGSLAGQLVDQSYGSPLLMQALCEQLCEQQGIWRTAPERVAVDEPNWEDFFQAMSGSVQPSVVEHLRIGPTQRRRRVQRELAAGGTVDLYSAVLLAIGRRLPKRQMSPQELSDEMNSFLLARPQLADIVRACREMSDIAFRFKGEGDSSLDYSPSPARLSVVDPYLAFFVRWGLHRLDLPDVGHRLP
jgi:hypothetical protein